MRTISTLLVLALAATLGAATSARAQPNLVQVVALDECDPDTFNAALAVGGVPFCLNVALGAQTTLSELFAEATAPGVGDPSWDFEPDKIVIKKGTVIEVADEGGEPHTFTEVKKFGGGFLDALNGGEAEAPECQGGFKNIAVARTRILQGSHLLITGLSKGTHYFECCIHPWMRMEVDVK
jgi:plastocyanin